MRSIRSKKYTRLKLNIVLLSDEEIHTELLRYDQMVSDPNEIYVGDVPYWEWEFLLLNELNFRLIVGQQRLSNMPKAIHRTRRGAAMNRVKKARIKLKIKQSDSLHLLSWLLACQKTVMAQSKLRAYGPEQYYNPAARDEAILKERLIITELARRGHVAEYTPYTKPVLQPVSSERS